MSYGDRLKHLRLSKGLTQEKLAEAIGTTKQNISQIEKDKNLPGQKLMIALADYFDVSLDYMFLRKEK